MVEAGEAGLREGCAVHWALMLFLIAATGCGHHRGVEKGDTEAETRRLLAVHETVGPPRLEIEILILGSDALETLVRITELRTGEVRAQIAQAEEVSLWDQLEAADLTMHAASPRDLNVRRWTVTDERILRSSLASFRELSTKLTPDEAVVLHAPKIILTASSGLSRIRAETFVAHPTGSAQSGPPNELSVRVGTWALLMLEALGVHVFTPK